MKTILATGILSATAAFAAATWVYAPPESASIATGASNFNAGLADADRIAALERAVSQEQQARQLLQEEVMQLTDELADLRDGAPANESGQRVAPTPEQIAARTESRRQRLQRRNDPGFRAARLTEAGIDPATAEWIVRREEELQMQSLRAAFEAERNDDSSAAVGGQGIASGDILRSELGDVDYERYLQANGRPTRIGVSSVLGSSPAQSAGVLPGDEIVRYDGERVFSINDIHAVAKLGEQGQGVVMEVVRDGQAMQVVIPRGPLGITGGRRRR